MADYRTFIVLMADWHEALRREARYAESDQVRQFLQELGFSVTSTHQGLTELDWCNERTWQHASQLQFHLHGLP